MKKKKMRGWWWMRGVCEAWKLMDERERRRTRRRRRVEASGRVKRAVRGATATCGQAARQPGSRMHQPRRHLCSDARPVDSTSFTMTCCGRIEEKHLGRRVRHITAFDPDVIPPDECPENLPNHIQDLRSRKYDANFLVRY
jgi:hypothetical protein